MREIFIGSHSPPSGRPFGPSYAYGHRSLSHPFAAHYTPYYFHVSQTYIPLNFIFRFAFYHYPFFLDTAGAPALFSLQEKIETVVEESGEI